MPLLHCSAFSNFKHKGGVIFVLARFLNTLSYDGTKEDIAYLHSISCSLIITYAFKKINKNHFFSYHFLRNHPV